jgi:catechol 2,3-dioxygenase-like lactoylglutathione lyase family enzyme
VSTARGGHVSEPALFFTTTVLVPACDVHAMVRWYTEKLDFRQVGIDEDDLASGPEAALKPGGDGEPLLLRRRAEQLPKATIEMFALDLHRVRKVLQARGVMTHLAGGEFSGPNYLWFEDVEGNTVKIIEKRFLG